LVKKGTNVRTFCVTRDVIGYVPLRYAVDAWFPIGGPLTLTQYIARSFFDVSSLKFSGVMTLTVWGHVTSSVTWP